MGGGQKFMIDMMPKVVTLRDEFASLHIQLDGGLNVDSARHAGKAGANLIVAGSSVFKAKDTDEDGKTITRLARSDERRASIDAIRQAVSKYTTAPFLTI